MKWTIGILTIPERAAGLRRLIACLYRDIRATPGALGDVEVQVHAGPGTIARKRQQILDTARGEYLCYIDDDDEVPGDYVRTIYPLLDAVDYIGFQLQLYLDGVAQKPTYHSLRYDRWWEDEAGAYRNISHLNPIRIEIARLGRFDGGYGEDRRWADQVAPHVRSEHYIDRVLYHYRWSSKGSASHQQEAR